LWGVVAGNWPDFSGLSHQSIPKKLHRSGGRGRSLLNFRVILIILTLLNLNMTTKLPCHTPLLRGDNEIQTYVGNKKVLYWFLITTL